MRAVVTIWVSWAQLARIDDATARAFPGRRGMRARFLRRMIALGLREWERSGSPPLLPPPRD